GLWDRRAWARERPEDLALDERRVEPLRIEGWVNFLWLGGVVVSALLPTPWRELLLAASAAGSLLTTPAGLRRSNAFTFRPIVEVAVLFAAIFATMIPALALPAARAPDIGLSEPWQFFWATGALSSFLDNAPTYLTFLSVAQGLGTAPEIAGTTEP